MKISLAFVVIVAVLILSVMDTVEAGFSAALQIGITKKIPAADCKRKAKKGDKLEIHYTGTLTDGTVFDSSISRGKPFSFTLGAGQVIKGWDQGILGMCIGEQRKLTIPPELGYGSRAIGKIPAQSTLIFTTELIGIEGYTPEVESEPVIETPPETIESIVAKNTADEAENAVTKSAEASKESLASEVPTVDLEAETATAEEPAKDEL
ncbi:hypothetical protein V1511DRAFT_493531 [Dipodascopsis uninucleata]